jgi:hypothetical protein
VLTPVTASCVAGNITEDESTEVPERLQAVASESPSSHCRVRAREAQALSRTQSIAVINILWGLPSPITGKNDASYILAQVGAFRLERVEVCLGIDPGAVLTDRFTLAHACSSGAGHPSSCKDVSSSEKVQHAMLQARMPGEITATCSLAKFGSTRARLTRLRHTT